MLCLVFCVLVPIYGRLCNKADDEDDNNIDDDESDDDGDDDDDDENVDDSGSHRSKADSSTAPHTSLRGG